MKRLFLSAIILCSTLILSGCQFFSEFVILNNSDDFIEVVYEAKKPDWKSLTPLYTTLKEFKDKKENWRIVPDDRQQLIEKGIIKIKLASNEVLRIESVDATRFEENPEEEFNTKSLRITGKNASINLEGKQVLEAFKPEYRSWSLITPTYPTYIFDYK